MNNIYLKREPLLQFYLSFICRRKFSIAFLVTLLLLFIPLIASNIYYKTIFDSNFFELEKVRQVLGYRISEHLSESFVKPGIKDGFLQNTFIISVFFITALGGGIAASIINHVPRKLRILFAEKSISPDLEGLETVEQFIDKYSNHPIFKVVSALISFFCVLVLVVVFKRASEEFWFSFNYPLTSVFILVLCFFTAYYGFMFMIWILITCVGIYKIGKLELNHFFLHPDGCNGFKVCGDIILIFYVSLFVPFLFAASGMFICDVYLIQFVAGLLSFFVIPISLSCVFLPVIGFAYSTHLYKKRLLNLIHIQKPEAFWAIKGIDKDFSPEAGISAYQDIVETKDLMEMRSIIKEIPVWPYDATSLKGVILTTIGEITTTVIDVVSDQVWGAVKESITTTK